MALDKIYPIHKGDLTISAEVKSAFLNNFATYYERIEDYNMASTMEGEAIKLDEEAQDVIGSAADCNNKTVFLLNLKKYKEAYKFSAKALVLLEPIVNI